MSVKPTKYEVTSLTPGALDEFLEQGWFRLRHFLHTTYFIYFDDKLYDATWLRIDLTRFQPDRKRLKLLGKAGFLTVTIAPYRYQPAINDLYHLYAEAMPFLDPEPLETLLGPTAGFEFNTHMVQLHHEGRLVACGIFDLGQHAAAGISSFYHPDYRKYSLGKVLVQLKLLYCRRNGVRWFYPGYWVVGHPRFGYKLNMCPEALEYFDLHHGQWNNFNAFDYQEAPLVRTRAALEQVQQLMQEAGARFEWMENELFDAAAWLSSEETLLHHPMVLRGGNPSHTNRFFAIGYDVSDHRYELYQCSDSSYYRRQLLQGSWHHPYALYRCNLLLTEHDAATFVPLAIRMVKQLLLWPEAPAMD